jgi:hypothetical protein
MGSFFVKTPVIDLIVFLQIISSLLLSLFPIAEFILCIGFSQSPLVETGAYGTHIDTS